MSNSDDVLFSYSDKDKKETRAGYGAGIVELARKNPNVIALTADLAGSLRLDDFIKEFPERFIQCGIAEANMMGIAAGMTIGGKIPYTGTFANFSTGRVYDQIRQSIAYSGKNVKICASHAGLTLGEDGATHQILEDIGMMKMLPEMTVVVPCDYNQTKAATIAIADIHGPVYLRFGRPKVPNFSSPERFIIGKAEVLAQGTDITFVACGHLVWNAIEAARELHKEGISSDVINMHTIKPFDSETLISSVRKTGCVVTAEEHQINGGLGESVAGTLSRYHPAPVEMIGVNDSFGESGKPEELMRKYGLDTPHLIEAARRVLARKNSGS